jgi:hypothetical protein
MSDAWLGFCGGLQAALVGGLVASIVQRHNELKRRKEETRLAVYLMLMELNSQYFWVASCQLRGEEPPTDVVIACREIAWKLADRLRAFDQVELIEEILEIIFSAVVPTANERAKKLDALLERYGHLVNPTYAKHIAKISRENIMSLGGGSAVNSYAPGLWQGPKWK